MESENGIEKYKDLLELPHPTSKRHPRMSLYERAAQFSPFAALCGHEAAIQETARITEQRVELEEDAKARLNEKLQILQKHLGNEVPVTITYFVPDSRKNGGAYVTCTGLVKKIDAYAHKIILQDHTMISMEQITELESDLFSGFFS